MEPNKLENQIKEKFNSREIIPSEAAWDRLDAMLSVAEEKKTKRSFGWLYIAASILVLVTAGTFFFNQKNTAVDAGATVVAKENKNAKDSSETALPIQENTVIPIRNQEQVTQITENKKQSSEKKSVSIINQKTKVNPIVNSLKEIIVQKELPKSEVQKTNVISNPISQNPNDVIALVQKKEPADPKIKVNANSLLSQVDGELNQTFRDKVLNKINKNYQEVKVALATRNQE